MKSIKYKVVVGQTNHGTEENPIIEQVFQSMETLCSHVDFETVLSHIRTIAYNGECTIEEDGQPEPEPAETADDVLNVLLGVYE